MAASQHAPGRFSGILQGGNKLDGAFPLGFDELSFYDVNMKRVDEPGRFEVMVGGSSDNVKKTNLDVAGR